MTAEPLEPTRRTSRATTPKSGYSAKNLSVLEGLEAVRKRPGMYIGSTDSRGLMHCVWEILDNSVDEALGGWCTRIDMILRADGSVEIHDDGRGIPVDVEPRTRLTGVEVNFKISSVGATASSSNREGTTTSHLIRSDAGTAGSIARLCETRASTSRTPASISQGKPTIRHPMRIKTSTNLRRTLLFS